MSISPAIKLNVTPHLDVIVIGNVYRREIVLALACHLRAKQKISSLLLGWYKKKEILWGILQQ